MRRFALLTSLQLFSNSSQTHDNRNVIKEMTFACYSHEDHDDDIHNKQCILCEMMLCLSKAEREMISRQWREEVNSRSGMNIKMLVSQLSRTTSLNNHLNSESFTWVCVCSLDWYFPFSWRFDLKARIEKCMVRLSGGRNLWRETFKSRFLIMSREDGNEEHALVLNHILVRPFY